MFKRHEFLYAYKHTDSQLNRIHTHTYEDGVPGRKASDIQPSYTKIDLKKRFQRTWWTCIFLCCSFSFVLLLYFLRLRLVLYICSPLFISSTHINIRFSISFSFAFVHILNELSSAHFYHEAIYRTKPQRRKTIFHK